MLWTKNFFACEYCLLLLQTRGDRLDVFILRYNRVHMRSKLYSESSWYLQTDCYALRICDLLIVNTLWFLFDPSWLVAGSAFDSPVFSERHCHFFKSRSRLNDVCLSSAISFFLSLHNVIFPKCSTKCENLTFLHCFALSPRVEHVVTSITIASVPCKISRFLIPRYSLAGRKDRDNTVNYRWDVFYNLSATLD